jgi:TRAP-type C4-dicarboxylate transport system substrate-binding protein
LVRELTVTRILFFALVALASLGGPVSAQPVTLKLAFFTSDRTSVYTGAIAPFVAGVNAAGEGLVRIEVSPGGALGRDPRQQLQLVLDGTADIAFIVPGYTPEQFPDNGVIELPGLFSSAYEATHVYTRLVAEDALRGYEDLVVIGAFASEPSSIHSRLPIATLDDLAGQRVRANNPIEVAALEALGMTASMVPINQSPQAIASGALDGAALPSAVLVEFGAARMVTNHYLLPVASAPLALVMSRRAFDALPPRAQEIITEHAGQWTAEHFIAATEAEDERVLEMLMADPARHVVLPTEAEKERAAALFAGVVEDWLASDPNHPALLATVQDELLDVRLGL